MPECRSGTLWPGSPEPAAIIPKGRLCPVIRLLAVSALIGRRYLPCHGILSRISITRGHAGCPARPRCLAIEVARSAPALAALLPVWPG